MSRKRPHRGSRRRGTHPKAHKQRTFLEGTLRVIRPGLAEVQTSEGTFAVAKRGIREGMHGDTVQVSLVPMHGRGKDPVAYVQGVLQRACTEFVGTFGMADPLGVVTPLDARMVHDFFVLPEDDSARRCDVAEGDVVRACILEYPSRQSAGVATIAQRLGSPTELDVDVEAVIASYGLPTAFPEAALREAEAMGLDVAETLAAEPQRHDLRSHVCLTVDPADARDFDDAVGAWRSDDGRTVVEVHIADVTHYLRWDSSMDVEARLRTCSTYLVDRVIPMLPERLCNDLCSLRPCEDRLAMTVRMELDARGNVVAAEAFKSAIRSRARLSYEEVDQLLHGQLEADELAGWGPDASACADALVLLDEVARLRLAVRHERGAIDFVSFEPKVQLDESGRPVGIVVRRRTRATSLIEEAMLLANESVAKLLADHEVATAYRVHEPPSPDDLASCLPALRELGLVDGQLSQELASASPAAIQDILERSQGTSGAFLANTLLLRAQKRAIYLPHNEGHFALGASAYCHFTSPIRRYPDVLVHRALKRLLAGAPVSREQTAIEKSLPQLCRRCSEQERVADGASRASQNVKMAQYYSERLGERYAGIVCGCERFGLFVMIEDTCAEGFLPVRSLGDEWFSYSEEHMSLTGESTGRRWYLGQRVAVEVASVEVARGRIDLALAGASGRA